MPVWSWPGATVTRVVDGDSLIARLTRDIGFHGVTTFDQRLRLNRINTPPSRTIEGIAATEFVTAWVAARALSIETIKPYKYGDEWMAEVYNDKTENLSDTLVTQGLAAYWDGTGPRPGG